MSLRLAQSMPCSQGEIAKALCRRIPFSDLTRIRMCVSESTAFSAGAAGKKKCETEGCLAKHWSCPEMQFCWQAPFCIALAESQIVPWWPGAQDCRDDTPISDTFGGPGLLWCTGLAYRVAYLLSANQVVRQLVSSIYTYLCSPMRRHNG